LWLFVDKKFESIEGSKSDSIEPRQPVGSASVIEFGMDDESEDVNASDHDVS